MGLRRRVMTAARRFVRLAASACIPLRGRGVGRTPRPACPALRLGRALARTALLAVYLPAAFPQSAAGQPAQDVPAWAGCPIPELRASYRDALPDRSDTAALLAVEHEILALCAERAGLVARLLEANASIAEARAATRLLAPADGGFDATTAVDQGPPAASSLPASHSPDGGPATLSDFLSADAPAALDGDAISCPEPPAGPLYAVGSVYGRSGVLRAVLWRGGEAYVVSPGTLLPDGATVQSIGLEGVRLAAPEGGGVLPWR